MIFYYTYDIEMAYKNFIEYRLIYVLPTLLNIQFCLIDVNGIKRFSTLKSLKVLLQILSAILYVFNVIFQVLYNMEVVVYEI